MQRITELDQLRQARLPQLVDGAQKTGREPGALLTGAIFLQEEVAEALLEAVDELQGGLLGQVTFQVEVLFGTQVMAMAPHEGEQSAVTAGDRIEIAPTRQEVVVDQPDDVEAICHDAGIGEVLAHQGAVGRGQIHAYHPHFGFPFQAPQPSFQGGLRAS